VSTRTSSVLIGALGLLVILVAIFAAVKISDLNSKVSDLGSTTAGLEDQAAGLEDETKSGGKDVAAEIEDLSLGVKKLRDCLPELQNEITGLGVELEGSYSEGFYAYIENNSQVSSYCQPVVYPDTGQGGE
jgi:hypothetical protein